MDWDLGIVVEGALASGGAALPRLRAFAEHALVLASEPGRLDTFGRLDDVRWTLPPHIRELAFDFQAGGDGPRELHREWSTLLRLTHLRVNLRPSPSKFTSFDGSPGVSSIPIAIVELLSAVGSIQRVKAARLFFGRSNENLFGLGLSHRSVSRPTPPEG